MGAGLASLPLLLLLGRNLLCQHQQRSAEPLDVRLRLPYLVGRVVLDEPSAARLGRADRDANQRIIRQYLAGADMTSWQNSGISTAPRGRASAPAMGAD